MYALLSPHYLAERELSLTFFITGAPLTQLLTKRAMEVICYSVLTSAQLHTGQMLNSIRSGYKAMALSQDSKNAWIHIAGVNSLTYSLLDSGVYEEALVLTTQAMPVARTLPPKSASNAFWPLWEVPIKHCNNGKRPSSTLEEAITIGDMLGVNAYLVPVLSQQCTYYGVIGEWEQAYAYAMRAIALREKLGSALIILDFSHTYEIEALLCAGDKRRAREAVQRLKRRQWSNQRFRIRYLRAQAIFTAWEGESEQAIGYLLEATKLATKIGLPAEQWQIQATLGNVYEAVAEQLHARTAFEEAARIIQELAERIQDETLRSRFLAGPQIHPILQHAQRLAISIPDNETKQARP